MLVRGRIVHVFVDPATMQKKPVPDDVRAKLAPWIDHGSHT
jgi:acyl-CoA thioesterase FadM